MAHPLTKEDLDNINAALKAIRDTKSVIARAKIAEIPIEIQEEQLKQAEARLTAIKAGFFPSGRA